MLDLLGQELLMENMSLLGTALGSSVTAACQSLELLSHLSSHMEQVFTMAMLHPPHLTESLKENSTSRLALAQVLTFYVLFQSSSR